VTDEQFYQIREYIRKHASVSADMREIIGPLFDVELRVSTTIKDGIEFSAEDRKYIIMSPANHEDLRRRVRRLEVEHQRG
jgi:hypothetical protein